MNDIDYESASEDEMINENEVINYFPITSPAKPFTSLRDALAHDESNGFNLIDHLSAANSEDFFEDAIVIINKCRTYVQQNSDFDLDALKSFLVKKDGDEQYFRPVLEDDAFLMYIDDLEDMKDSHMDSVIENEANKAQDTNELQMKIQALEDKLHKASLHMAKLMSEEDDSEKEKKEGPDNDTYYFTSYSHSSIHETMLQDTIRTEAYQNAILGNPHLFKDKVVMDIGCGTGILSLFAAKAGAKKVIAIDASDMYKEATQIVESNGYQDVIHVCHGKIEDLIEDKLPDKLPLETGEQVDVVISEWMGYALFFETMLPSVMIARDRLMNKTGTMWPNRSIVYLEGARDNRLEYWSDVYGFNMNVMKDRVIKELRKDAEVEVVDAENIVTNRDEIVVHDLNTCCDKDLDFEVPFELKPQIDAPAKTSNGYQVDKLVISFDIDFDICGSTPISFSTGCQTKSTHWKQTTLWFDANDVVPVLSKNEVMKGSFRMARNEINPRDMDFLVQWQVGSYDESKKFSSRIDGTIVSKLGSN